MVARLVPQPWRLHIWLVYDNLRHPVFRRRAVRAPQAKLATVRGEIRMRRRSATSGPSGVERLPAILVINLASRPDRLAAFMGEMRRLRIEGVTRFDAIRSTNGKVGCARSHLECARLTAKHAWDVVMVCEDDARFLVGRRELDVLVEAFLDDHEAEIACLAYREEAVEPHSPLFLRARRVTTRACYLVKSSIVGDLIRVWEEGIVALESGGEPGVFAGDQIWKLLQDSRVFVIPVRRAVYQAPGYSDVEARVIASVRRS